jgi:hypothetical protein
MTTKEFINQVFLNEYERIVRQEFYYISFALVGTGIEFLGACLDPYDLSQNSLSRARFTNAVETLFAERYHQHSKLLYESCRCGFAHQMRPGPRLWLTHREESRREGTEHLGPFKGGTVLVAEDFYSDFRTACTRVVEMIDKGVLSHSKASGRFLTIT